MAHREEEVGNDGPVTCQVAHATSSASTFDGEESLNEHEVDAAAKLRAAARVSGQPWPRLPESCRPTDLESALAVQRRTVELLKQTVRGWKCSLPPAPDRIPASPANIVGAPVENDFLGTIQLAMRWHPKLEG